VSQGFGWRSSTSRTIPTGVAGWADAGSPGIRFSAGCSIGDENMMFRIAIGALLVLGLSGCISVKSYVDPTYGKTGYQDLNKPAQPIAMRVNVEFSRQGKRLPRADNQLRGDVERVLRGSGLVAPQPDAAAAEITVSVNNVGDVGAAAAKGFGTGLTFGLAGSTVQDGYEMTVTLTRSGVSVTKSGYKHVIISTVGNKAGPPGLSPTTPSGAFGTVVEQLLLNALADFQKDGALLQAKRNIDAVWMASCTPGQ
jgi:hypothetical protein